MSIKVKLGEQEYEIPMLVIGQLERATILFAADLANDKEKAAAATFSLLRIGLERATPAVPKPDEIAATRDEVQAAVEAIMVYAGFKDAKIPNPPAPPAGAEN